jgi:hypothetical protein
MVRLFRDLRSEWVTRILSICISYNVRSVSTLMLDEVGRKMTYI